jgi:hypothetical protein
VALDVIEWLLDTDPAIRWQVMRDLMAETPEVVAAERGRVADEGWGSQLLDLQEPGGTWDGGTYRPGWVDRSKPFFDAWTATHFSLQNLCHLGLEPESPRMRLAVGLLRENVRWEANDALYFEGETEPCINGAALAVGSYLGEEMQNVVDRLVSEQLGDGGWNCWAEYGATVGSFHTTICVLEGLLARDRAGAGSTDVGEARLRGEEYLLERSLFRSRSTGDVIDPRFTMFSYPTYWYYDVLRALDYFRSVGRAFDDRCAEAIDLMMGKRDAEGRWPLENVHQGPTHLRMEGSEGSPSRWNTLRSMRVMRWAGID